MMRQEILIFCVGFLVAFNVFQQPLGTEIHGFRLMLFNQHGQVLQARQDIGAFDIRDVGQQVRQEGLIFLFVRKLLVKHHIKGAGRSARVSGRGIMVNQTFVQIGKVGVDAFIQFPAGSVLRKVNLGQQCIEFLHRAMTRVHKLKELEGIEETDKRIGIRHGDGRIIVIFTHDGQVHRLRIGDGDFRVHVVQQIHVKEQVSRYGGNQPQRLFFVWRFVHPRYAKHVTHTIVDGFRRGGQSERGDGSRHHFADVSFGEQMAAYIVVTVEFFNVDDFRGNGTHLQKKQLPVFHGPFNVFLLAKSRSYLFPSFVKLFYLVFIEQIITARTIAFAGNLVAMGGDLPRNQVFALPFDRFYQDG